ncbi:MAG: helix-turn-helix transcriptional regulator [Lachnospiraceae bacterium]|nr:helix-turn-helix transcriptional regulator [Lachnospiraceae bacterium]
MSKKYSLSDIDKEQICNWKEDDSIFNMRLGLKIRFYRKSAGMSQRVLAELIDVSTVYISQAETGRFVPSLPMFVKICNALEISPNDLLYDSLYAHAQKRGRRFQTLVEEYDSDFEDMAYAHLKRYLEDLKSVKKNLMNLI